MQYNIQLYIVQILVLYLQKTKGQGTGKPIIKFKSAHKIIEIWFQCYGLTDKKEGQLVKVKVKDKVYSNLEMLK